MKESMTFYPAFYESAQFLSDSERLKFYEAVIEYGLHDAEPELYGMAMALFTAVKPLLDGEKKRRQINAENGKKGGRPKKTAETKQVPVEPKKRPSKPKIEEIKEYVESKGYHVDAEQFFNFYESKGWKVGKETMKNWHSAVATWEKRWVDEHPMQKTDMKPVVIERKEENPAVRESLLDLLKA